MVHKINHKFRNAFYLLDTDVFSSNFNDLIGAFKRYYLNSRIAYSYKTNYTPALVKIVDGLGGYAEVVSDMELDIARRAGVKPECIIWNGPIKKYDRVKELLLCGGTVNIDSICELKAICDISKDFPDKLMNVGIRCNYAVGDGVLSRFGIDVDGEDFHNALKMISNTSNIKLASLQAHFAKRDPGLWRERALGMLRTYDVVLSEYRIELPRLDIGGGIYGNLPECLRTQLGVNRVSYNDYAVEAATYFARRFSGQKTQPELLIEPGSALAGDCMRFVCQVETIKNIRGKTFATVNGSQKNISMNGLNPPMEVISGSNKQDYYSNVDIVGYTCIEGDVLQKNYSGPLAVGDYIVFSNCGSYSLVMKPPFIFPNCPVVDISNGDIRMIKRAETVDDLLHTYVF